MLAEVRGPFACARNPKPSVGPQPHNSLVF
jgi:hypothetical protein